MRFPAIYPAAALIAALLATVPVSATYAQPASEWRAPGPAHKMMAEKAETVRTSPTVDSPAPAPSPAARQIYHIGTGDKLKVAVYNSEKLSGDYPVGGDGKIALPMLGRVAVSGLSLDEATALLTQRLADGYFQNPQITVDIAEYRPVYILGEVQKPGQYPYAEGMTVYRLVAQAGGYSYRANRKKMDVRHDSEPGNSAAKITDGALVQPGDTIIVGQRYF